MSKEYNLAGKQLVVDGITILGNRKKQRSSILTQAITNGELARDNALTGEQVEALGGTVVIISEDLTETKGQVATNKTNIEGLDGRVETAEGAITSQGTRLETAEGNISSQGLRLTDAEGNIIAQGLRLDTAEDDITSQGTRIGTAEGNISSLDGRMGTAEGDISSQGTRLTTAEGNISSQGVRITDAEGNIVAQGLRITDAEGNITAQGLRLTDAEGNIVAQGLRLSTAEGDISAQGLRLTTAEGNISAQGLRLTDAEGNILAQGLRITDAEGKLLNLELVTKRFDVRSKQTTIIRDDTQKGSQEVVLQSTIIGYEDPQPRLAIMTSFTIERICAMEADPSTLIDESDIGSSITPTPSGEGSWYRGGLLFQVGDSAAFIQYSGAVYQTVLLTVSSVSDNSITGTITGILPTARGVDDRDMTLVTLYIPYRKAGKVEASLYNNTTLMDQLTLPVTNHTRRWKEIPSVENYAELSSIIEDEQGYLVDGDCCVVKYTDVQGTPTFTNTTYILKNGTWEIADETAEGDAQQIIKTIYTVVNNGEEYKADHPDYKYENLYVGTEAIFKILKVGVAYIGKIFAEEIYSSRWGGVDSEGYPIEGFHLSTTRNLMEAVAAVFKGARIRESELYDVNITSLDRDGQGTLLKTNRTVTAPTTNPALDTESSGVYVESAIRTYTWNSSQLTTSNRRLRKEYSKDKTQTMTFTVKNDCRLYLGAPYWNRAIISGTAGTMRMTVTRTRSGSSTVVYDYTGSAYNETIGTYADFLAGDQVSINIVFTAGNDFGITGITYASVISMIRYYDLYKRDWVEGGTYDKGLSVNAYGISTTVTATHTSTSGTTVSSNFELFFPVMVNQDTYLPSPLDTSNVLVDGTSAASKASLVTTAYNAIAPLLNAKGTQGGVQVDAIPRGGAVSFAQTTAWYKRDPYVVNGLILTDNYAIFLLDEAEQFTVSKTETGTVKYSIALSDIDPSLTVTNMMPVDPTTDIGSSTKQFKNVHAETIRASVIAPDSGETLAIQADTISGDLTGDVTGNVNSAGTQNVVYGAVFN